MVKKLFAKIRNHRIPKKFIFHPLALRRVQSIWLSFQTGKEMKELRTQLPGLADRIERMCAASETGFLEIEDPEESLFEDSLLVSGETQGQDFSEENLLEILGERQPGSYTAQIDRGAWHFILLKLEDENQVPAVMAKLNSWFAAEGLEAQAVDWKAASGGFGSLADTLQIVFNVLILIIAVVAIIIIMN